MTYDYKCRCGLKFEAFNRMGERLWAQCPRCGKRAKMLFSPPRAVHIFKPYWDPHIGNDGPIYLESYKQKRRILHEQGLEEM